LVICGESGSGKTHLAHIWQNASYAIFLSTQDFKHESDFDHIFKQSSAFIIDDERCLEDEKNFLHFYNLAKEQNLWLLINIAANPKYIDLPDLRSRFLSLPILFLENPDEELLRVLLGKQLAEKQLHISNIILEYITKRVDRSFLAARQMVGLIEEEVRLSNCKITINLIKKILARRNSITCRSPADT
jgi:chromosomal replication initiation ATPase DnaA